MTPDTSNETSDLHVSRYDYGDRWVVAVDVGAEGIDDAVTVELVEGGAIVAVDTPAVRTQFDLDLPGDATDHAVNNGVLVVEGTN